MNSQDFLFERTLPVFFLLVPNDEKLYKDNLFEKMRDNQQIFITPFDIYNTLIHLSSGGNKLEYKKNSVPFGSSVFFKLNYKKRYCNSTMFKFLFPKRVCNCKIK